ncbi:hypothetical protein [Nocardia xishanensis]
MYVDLLTNAGLLDPSVWASPDTWTTAMEYAAKKKKKSNSGLLFGGICCLLVVVAIGVGIYLLLNKRKQGNQQPPNGQPPYGAPGQPPYGQPGQPPYGQH